jgi:hypothetical protein
MIRREDMFSNRRRGAQCELGNIEISHIPKAIGMGNVTQEAY